MGCNSAGRCDQCGQLVNDIMVHECRQPMASPRTPVDDGKMPHDPDPHQYYFHKPVVGRLSCKETIMAEHKTELPVIQWKQLEAGKYRGFLIGKLVGVVTRQGWSSFEEWRAEAADVLPHVYLGDWDSLEGAQKAVDNYLCSQMAKLYERKPRLAKKVKYVNVNTRHSAVGRDTPLSRV